MAERLPSGSADFSRTLSSTLPCLGGGVAKHLAAVHQARPGVCVYVCMCVCQRRRTSARVWHAGALGGAYMFAGAEAIRVAAALLLPYSYLYCVALTRLCACHIETG